MRYRNDTQHIHPALISLLLLGMVFFLIVLPSIVFATTISGSDTLPRYTLTPKELGQKVAEAIIETGMADMVEATVQVEDNNTVFGSDKAMTVEVKGLQADHKTKKWSANILFKHEDEVMSAMPMQGKFQALIELPALTRPLNNGDIVQSEHISVQAFPQHFSKNDIITDANDLLGKQVKRTLSANRPVRQHEVSAPTIVKRNHIMHLTYSNNGLHISTSGQAMVDAAAGDVIDFKNINSNQIVRAVIVNSKSATVRPYVQTSDSGGNHATVN